MTEITWTNETRKLSDLIPWERNPRTITHGQATRLIDSVESFGQVETLAIGPDNELYNGHQRLKVLMQEHGDMEVDVRVASRPLTEKEREKLTVYLHKGAAGDWDFDMLADEFNADDLVEWGFEAFELGIDEIEPEPLDDDGGQIDRAEELREKWDVESGQLWQLGEHRLICGDCTDAAVVERVMGGKKAEICFTSPPYSNMRTYSGNDLSVQALLPFIKIASDFCVNIIINLGLQTKKCEIVPYWNDYIAYAVNECRLKFLSWSVWDRGEAGTIAHNTSYIPIEHEWIFIFGSEKLIVERTVPLSDSTHKRRKSHKRTESGSRIIAVRQADGSFENSTTDEHNAKKIGSVFRSPPYKAREGIDHSAIFPVELPSAYIESMTGVNDLIYEPFSGSGTTLIACEQLNRRCRAVEISPGYVAVALQRWSDATGETPVIIDS